MNRLQIGLAALTLVSLLAAGCAGSKGLDGTGAPGNGGATADTPAVPNHAAPAGSDTGAGTAPATDAQGGQPTLATKACAPGTAHADFDAMLSSYQEREADLLRALTVSLAGQKGPGVEAAIRQAVPCAEVQDAHSSADSLLIITLDLPEGSAFPFFGNFGVLAWPYDDQWRFLSLVDPEELVGLDVLGVSDGDLIIYSENPGTGHYGDFRLYRLEETAHLLWSSPVFEKFSPRLLSENLVEVIHRAPEEWELPHLWQANCCIPINGQSLWERQGDQFVELASRIISTPYRTVSLLAGAMAAGDEQVLHTLVADETLQTLLRSDGSGYEPLTPENELNDYDIWEAEADSWEALPEELRGPPPAKTRLVWPAQPVSIILERIGGSWVVTGWEPNQG